MSTMAVVVPHIGAKDPLQLAPIHDQEVVEALSSDHSHEPLGVGIGIRRPKWCPENLSACASEDVVEAGDIFGVSVTEQERDVDTFVFKIAGDIPRLLGHPGPVRMGCHSSDPNPSWAELDEEEHLEPFEHERVDGEEVGGHDMRCLGSEECTPRGTGVPGRRSDPVVLQYPGNRARR